MRPIEVLNKLNESDELKKTLINDVKTDLNIEPGSDEEEALDALYDTEDEEKKFEDYVLDDFTEYISYKYDCNSYEETEKHLNSVSEDDINDYMSGKIHEFELDVDGVDDLNKAEDFLRTHFGLQDKLEEDFIPDEHKPFVEKGRCPYCTGPMSKEEYKVFGMCKTCYDNGVE